MSEYSNTSGDKELIHCPISLIHFNQLELLENYLYGAKIHYL